MTQLIRITKARKNENTKKTADKRRVSRRKLDVDACYACVVSVHVGLTLAKGLFRAFVIRTLLSRDKNFLQTFRISALRSLKKRFFAGPHATKTRATLEYGHLRGPFGSAVADQRGGRVRRRQEKRAERGVSRAAGPSCPSDDPVLPRPRARG
jgi:hypothetical protein